MSFEPIKTGDDSLTFFNTNWGEHYHSVSMGAYSEALYKHVLPPIALKPELLSSPKVRILDICFGLGYNTLVTLKEYAKRGFKGEIEIYSPEMDCELLKELYKLEYHQELHEVLPYLYELLRNRHLFQDGIHLELFVGDARAYLGQLAGEFDIVYQDAFSPVKNPGLWSVEYFKELRRILRECAIVTTYTQSSSARYGAFLAGFHVYEYSENLDRSGTILSPAPLPLKEVDFAQKILLNPSLKPFVD